MAFIRTDTDAVAAVESVTSPFTYPFSIAAEHQANANANGSQSRSQMFKLESERDGGRERGR